MGILIHILFSVMDGNNITRFLWLLRGDVMPSYVKLYKIPIDRISVCLLTDLDKFLKCKGEKQKSLFDFSLIISLDSVLPEVLTFFFLVAAVIPLHALKHLYFERLFTLIPLLVFVFLCLPRIRFLNIYPFKAYPFPVACTLVLPKSHNLRHFKYLIFLVCY